MYRGWICSICAPPIPSIVRVSSYPASMNLCHVGHGLLLHTSISDPNSRKSRATFSFRNMLLRGPCAQMEAILMFAGTCQIEHERKGFVSVIRPRDALLNAAKILAPSLLPKGFEFRFREEGRGSGGDFAWRDYVRGDRQLELHFRWSLGLVRYHIGNQSASHGSYMSELGVWEQCKYPGFSEDPMTAFQGLAHDLSLAEDFLGGPAIFLRRAAAKESPNPASKDADQFPAH